MSMESAKTFITRVYEDDDFMKEVFKNGGFSSEKIADKEASKRVQCQKFTEVGQKLGFDFDVNECISANETYVKNLGAWKGIKMIFHMMKVCKAAEKEMKKQNK